MGSSDRTSSDVRTGSIPGPRGGQAPGVRSDPLEDLAAFPLVEALFGRRSRRFALGDEIPDGPLAYRSRHEPVPLTELERMLVLSAMGGTTGWHYSITRNARYAPHPANYAGAAAGRTFPSAAGFHTAELFFTDDSGTYFFPTRDAGALVDPSVEDVTPQLMVERHTGRLRRLSEKRLHLPAEEPYLEGHNTWCVNVPGSLLVIPVADIAQHLIAILCFFTSSASSRRTATPCSTTSTAARSRASSGSATLWTSTRRSPSPSPSSTHSPRPPRSSPPAATQAC